MNGRKRRKVGIPAIAAALSVCLAAGCSAGRGNDGLGEETLRRVYVRAVQEGEVPEPMSRTFIGGEALDRCFWSERDTIGVYYRSADDAGSPVGRAFGCYRAYPGEALFSAEMPAMAEGEYSYYGVYPLPERTDGTSVTWHLPAVQSGRYRGYSENFDFMLAAPVRGQALTSAAEELSMNFIHQCHVMRIQIPEGRNLWGVGVRKLRVEFPRDVVGTMTADMADPTAPPVLTEGGATVTAVLPEPLHESEEDSPEGAYVWLFLCPGQVSGTVRFTAYDANGYQSASLEVEMDRMLEAGRITPVNLTVPQELPVAWIDLSITGNNLGEEPERFTVRAPEGAKFRNGTDTCSFEINSQNSYRLCYYDRYDGIENGALMKSGEFTFTYESASAVVSEKRAVAPFPEAGGAPVGLTVPYLFYEDFGGAAGGGDDSAVELDGYSLPGWSGSRFGLEAGTAARMSAYLGSAVLTNPDGGDNKRGRLDTPHLTGIKDGAVVTLSVSFDVGGTKADGTLSNCKVLYSMYEFGRDTGIGAIAYTNAIEYVVIDGEDAGTDGGYTNLPLHKEVEVPDCTNAHRLSWRTSFRVYDPNFFSALTAKTVYVYIDNIKVSIKR